MQVENTARATQPLQKSASGQSSNGDFQTFLRMLTTQLQNQDPLNPIESTDFAVQLATFSGVEQQTRTNEQLEKLSDQMGLMSLGQLTGWIGFEARTTAPIAFDGSPVTLLLAPHPSADGAVLVVRDGADRVISREAVAPDRATADWAGTTGDGTALSSGVYRFELESYGNGELLGTSQVESFARIAEARRDQGGEVVLALPGGVSVSASQVKAVRPGGSV